MSDRGDPTLWVRGTFTAMKDDQSHNIEYLDWSNVTIAERGILHEMLFKEPEATKGRNKLFEFLQSHPDFKIPLTVPHCRLPDKVDGASTGIPINHHPNQAPTGIETPNTFNQNGHHSLPPMRPEQGSAVLVLDEEQRVGPPRGVYTGGPMVQIPPPGLVYHHQQQFGGPPNAYLAHHLPPHLNQFQMGLPHVSFHAQAGGQGFPGGEDLLHQKSPESGSSGKGYNPNNNRKGPRPRNQQPNEQMSQYSVQFYSGIQPYGAFLYNPGMPATVSHTVSSVTGQPIIIPSSHPPPLYTYQQPQVYTDPSNQGAEVPGIVHSGLLVNPKLNSPLQVTKEDTSVREEENQQINPQPQVADIKKEEQSTPTPLVPPPVSHPQSPGLTKTETPADKTEKVTENVTYPDPSPHSIPSIVEEVQGSKSNSEFPELGEKSNGMVDEVVTQGESHPVGRSWASIASSKVRNGLPPIIPTHSTSTKEQQRREGESLKIEGTRHSFPSPSFDPASLSDESDALALALGEFLSKYKLNHHSLSLTPRGLVNQSNFCYINATLQSLIACPPFVNLFRSLEEIIGKKPCKATPILQSVFDFVMNFEPITRFNQNNKNKRPQDAFYVGPHLDPTGIRRVLAYLDGATFKVEGRQEDAEEFLSHLLNGLHDEMIKTIRWYETKKEKTHSKIESSEDSLAADNAWSGGDEDSDWQVMGPKNKGSMTRKTELRKSPISEMFVGQMSSLLNRGNTPKTTTLQPFFTLQLDIQDENIHSVKDALEGLSTKEEVSGSEVPIWKQLSLEFLPIILVIHLKRFVYDKASNKIDKLDKRVDFGVDLEIGKELLSPNSRSKVYNQKQRSYKLFAAVYHDGEEAHKGHYVADTFHPTGGSLWGQFGWIRYDDTQVKGIQENQILNPHQPRVPYLLYYRRVDTLSPGKPKQDHHPQRN